MAHMCNPTDEALGRRCRLWQAMGFDVGRFGQERLSTATLEVLEGEELGCRVLSTPSMWTVHGRVHFFCVSELLSLPKLGAVKTFVCIPYHLKLKMPGPGQKV